MSKVTIRFAALSVSVLAIAVAAPAFAQNNANAGAASDTAEIIVTAQKRPEKLQQIPVAASVMSSESIAQQHVSDLSDINRVVPSVEIKGTFNGRVPYSIRGISTNANEGAIGLTSGVSIQVDGVPVPADSFAANTISDVAQLEVLKGPQATLGGRTASAGVINFVTYSPTTTQKFGMDLTGTGDGEYRINAHVSGPINDVLSYSIAGYDSHVREPIFNLLTNTKSKADSAGIRAKLKFAPSSDFDATLMGHYALSTSQGENFIYQYITPGATLLGAPPLTQALLLGAYTPHYGNTSYASPVNMTSRYQDSDGALVMNYRAGGLTLSSTTSYFHEKQFQSQDLFETDILFFNFLTGGHAPPFNDMQSNDGYVRQVTQEFKLASDASKPLNFIAGAYYSDMTVHGYGLRQFAGFPASDINESKTKSYAAYLRVNDKLSDLISLTGGLRYNEDKIAWNINELFNPAAGQYGTGNFGVGGFAWALSDSKGTLVGDASAQFHIAPHQMAYLSYTRGYKPEAYNTAHTFSVAPSAVAGTPDAGFTSPTKGETIDSFEVGLKTTAMGGHLTFNADAFYTNYKNYQAQIFDNTQLIGILVLSNAGASTKGVEADVNYRKGNTTFSVSGAYIDAQFKDFPSTQCYPTQTVAQGCVGGTQSLSGHSLPDSPKFKANASIQQTIPLDKVNVLLGSNLAYRTSAVLQSDGNPETYQGAFALLDASIGLQSKDKALSLTFFVNNITNHFYLSNAEDFFSGPWGANAVIGQPARDSHRDWGARLGVNF